MCSGLWEGAFGIRLDWVVAAVAVAAAAAAAAAGAGKLGYSGRVGVSLGDSFFTTGLRCPDAGRSRDPRAEVWAGRLRGLVGGRAALWSVWPRARLLQLDLRRWADGWRLRREWALAVWESQKRFSVSPLR